jgi:hypothetical protein
MLKVTATLALILVTAVAPVLAQTDATTPLHLLKPDYPIPYGIPKQEEVTAVLNRVFGYLDGVTPPGFQNEKTGELFTDAAKIDQNTILQRGDFRIVSYEWGVTYAGMLLASEATGDPRYREYVDKRLAFIAQAASAFRKPSAHYEEWEGRMPLRNLINPRALDDTGAMSCGDDQGCPRGKSRGIAADLRTRIESHHDRTASARRWNSSEKSSAAKHALARRYVHERSRDRADGQVDRGYKVLRRSDETGVEFRE